MSSSQEVPGKMDERGIPLPVSLGNADDGVDVPHVSSPSSLPTISPEADRAPMLSRPTTTISSLTATILAVSSGRSVSSPHLPISLRTSFLQFPRERPPGFSWINERLWLSRILPVNRALLSSRRILFAVIVIIVIFIITSAILLLLRPSQLVLVINIGMLALLAVIDGILINHMQQRVIGITLLHSDVRPGVHRSSPPYFVFRSEGLGVILEIRETPLLSS